LGFLAFITYTNGGSQLVLAGNDSGGGAGDTDFKPLSTILGKGTTNQAQTYTDTDYYPSSGINYYRLKQVDRDGSIRYSKIISVVFDESISFEAVLYPNPTETNTFSLLFEEEIGEIKVAITDLLGRTVANTSKQENAFTYQVSLQNTKLAGTYIIRISTEKGQVVKKLVVR
jgi:trimeric autotransporter adhesin